MVWEKRKPLLRTAENEILLCLPCSPTHGVFLWQWIACMHAKLLQSSPTLCNNMDSSPPGSSVHEILQARILVRVAISFSRGGNGLL